MTKTHNDGWHKNNYSATVFFGWTHYLKDELRLSRLFFENTYKAENQAKDLKSPCVKQL